MYRKMYFANLRRNVGAGLFVPKILWKKKCNSCNIKLERYFYHEIMHCSCSVQSLIPDGTDTERDHRSGRRDLPQYTEPLTPAPSGKRSGADN